MIIGCLIYRIKLSENTVSKSINTITKYVYVPSKEEVLIKISNSITENISPNALSPIVNKIIEKSPQNYTPQKCQFDSQSNAILNQQNNNQQNTISNQSNINNNDLNVNNIFLQNNNIKPKEELPYDQPLKKCLNTEIDRSKINFFYPTSFMMLPREKTELQNEFISENF